MSPKVSDSGCAVTYSHTRAVWLAVAVGLVLRLAFGLGYWVGQPLNHDEREYLLLARSLAEGRGFAYTALDGSPLRGEHYGRAPLYPVLLSAVLAVTPASLTGAGDGPADIPVAPRAITVIRVLQAWMGSLTILLIAALARRAAGSRAATAAAWLAAIYPPLVWTPAFVFSETLFIMVAYGAALALTPCKRSGAAPPIDARRAFSVGALLGAGVLVRPAMLFFIALAAPWLWWRRARLAAVVLLGASILVIMPWSIRNTVVYGRFVAVASEGGITFWTGNHPLAIGEGDMAANPDIKRANVAFRERHQGLSAEALEPLYYREAFVWIRAHPVDWLALVARKVFYTVVPTGPSYRLHSRLYYWGTVIPYLSALALAIVGIMRIKRQGRLPVPLLLLAASSILVELVFFPQERYRIPGIDPVLIVLASGLWLQPRDIADPPS